jgi:hypothetical protein
MSPEISVYLDLDTGEVINVTEDIRFELDAIYEELPEDQTEEEHAAAFAAALERRDPQDWMNDVLKEADAVERGDGTRYLRLPDRDSREGYGVMEAFIETVARPQLQELLWSAIRGRGAFRRFKDVLIDDPAENERWFAFKATRMRERVLEWLADERIQLVE